MRALTWLLGGVMLWMFAAGGAAAQEPSREGVPAEPPSARADQAADRAVGAVEVDPAAVVVGMFYNGATVHASAVVPEGSRVAILCRGEVHTLSMKKKGKVLGVLWMNTGDIEFRDVPGVYMLRTSTPLDGLAPEPMLRELDLGFDALARESTPAGQDPSLFDELVRLREKERLWSVEEGAVELTGADHAAAALATADFALPPKVPPGEYEILVYAFDGLRPELIGEKVLTVQQAGVTAAITELAMEHGLLYGILAVVIAIVVGLFTGVVFGIGSKGAH